MIEVETKSGFKFGLDEKIFDSWKMLKAIRNADSPDPVRKIDGVVSIEEMLLGDLTDEYENHIAEMNDGHVPADIVSDDMIGILEARKELKNSSSSEG